MANGMLPITSQTIGGKGGLGSFLFGSKDRISQVPTVNSQQQSALQQILSQGLSGIQNPTQGFEPIAQNATNQFQQNIVPSIAERFSGLGAGAQRSSAFGQQLGAAGAGLSSNLAAQEAQYGQQALGPLLQLLQFGLRPQFENAYQPGQSGLFGGAAKGLIGAGGQALGAYFGMTPIMSAISALLQAQQGGQ